MKLNFANVIFADGSDRENLENFVTMSGISVSAIRSWYQANGEVGRYVCLTVHTYTT